MLSFVTFIGIVNNQLPSPAISIARSAPTLPPAGSVGIVSACCVGVSAVFSDTRYADVSRSNYCACATNGSNLGLP